MKPFDVVVKPLEVLAGREYPDVWSKGDYYDSDWENALGRQMERRAFFGDVVHLEGIKKGLGWLAGREFPDADRIRHEVSSGCDGPFDVESNVHYHRQEFRKSLIHLEGLRQAIQQRREY
jgi:hypothetical protein